MDYESMSIEQLKAEGNRTEGLIADMRKESRARAAVLDRKLRLKPILATPNDMVIVPGGPSIADQIKALPVNIRDQIKAFLNSEEK